MPDPLRKVQRGQKLKSGLSAAAWNSFIDNLKGGRETGAGGIDDLISPANTAFLLWDGDPVASLKAFSVLGYGDPVRSPADNAFVASERPVFESAAASPNKPFAITLKPVAGGKVVKAAVSGLAVVQVSVSSASHWRAKPSAGVTANLVSAASGGVPILWKESGTGTKWAMVLLDFGDSAARSSDCTSFLGSLKPGRCYRLTTDAGDGSCSCVPAGQAANLTYDVARKAHTSNTLLYGCPPGVFTTLCPQPAGAPRKWNLPVAGFTGGSTAFNQNYTIGYASGEAWLATKEGVSVTATQTSAGVWSLTLDDGETVVTYAAEGVTGCCSAITFTLVDDGGAEDAPSSLTLSPASGCGKGPAYRPVLDKCTTECMRNARLRWEPVAGSGAKTILFDPPVCGVDASGNKYADFSTDDPLLCTGTDAGGCADNKFTVRVTCGCNPVVVCGVYELPAAICLFTPLVWGDGSVGLWSTVTASETPGTWLGETVWYILGGGGGDPYSEEIRASIELTIGCDAGGVLTAYLDITFTSSGTLLCTQHASGAVAIADGSPLFTLAMETTGGSYCPGHKWDVVAGFAGLDGCPFDGDGECGVPEAAELTVASGAYAGTYSSTWESGGTGGTTHADFSFGSPAVSVSVLFVGGSWLAVAKDNAGTVIGFNSATSLSPAIDFGYFATPLDSSLSIGPCGAAYATYVCLNGVCTAVYDGSGTSLAACVAACGQGGGGGGGTDGCFVNCALAGHSPTMVIPDGPKAGTYPASYGWQYQSGASGSQAYQAGFAIGGILFASVTCHGPGLPGHDPTIVQNRLSIADANPYTGFDIGSSACGTPSVMTFPGSRFGSSGDITVTT